MYDLIIIGGGPAGITAGIYAARQRIKTLLVTKNFGGQIAKKAVAIENYPGFKKISGLDLIKKFEEHLREQDIDIKMTEVTKVEKKDSYFLVWTNGKDKFESKTIIIATGADPRPLKVPGEKKFIGKGVSFCAVCDGPLFVDKQVAVIGGGNSGFESALFLKDLAKKIYILEFSSQVKADKLNQEIVQKAKNIEIITNVKLKEIKGGNFVDSIVYEDTKTGKDKELPVGGVFVEIGLQPVTSLIKGMVEINKKDEIVVDYETCQTKTPGLFAAGDINVGGVKQIVTACGEGAKAALAVFNFLKR